MKKPSLIHIVLLLVGIVVGGYGVFIGMSILQYLQPGSSTSPTIAGQPVPEEEFDIDFTKRYDLYLNIRSEPQVLENSLIRGFTREYKPDGIYKGGYGYFERWLVVETKGSQLAYVPARSIDLIRETSVAMEP